MTKTCPTCGDSVREGAARCAFCGHLFKELTATAPAVRVPALETEEVMELLGSLVDRSLVIYDEDRDRFRLLDSVRDYAHLMLSDTGEEESVKRRHALCYTELVEQRMPDLQGAEVVSALGTLGQEESNVRAAFDWSVSHAEGQGLALRICAALALYWDMRGQFVEGRSCCAVALSAADASAAGIEPKAKAVALTAAGNLAFAQNDHERAAQFHQQALSIQEELAEPDGLARSLHNLAMAEAALGDLDSSLSREERALALNRELGNLPRQASNLNGMAMIAAQRGDVDGARSLFEETHRLSLAAGDRWSALYALHNLAELLVDTGDRIAGRCAANDCLEECCALEVWPLAALAAEVVARLEHSERRIESAAEALGAADAIRKAIDLPRSEGLQKTLLAVEEGIACSDALIEIRRRAAGRSRTEALNAALVAARNGLPST